MNLSNKNENTQQELIEALARLLLEQVKRKVIAEGRRGNSHVEA